MRNSVREIDISRALVRYFTLPQVSHNGKQWALLSDVDTDFGNRVTTLRSIVQVRFLGCFFALFDS